jgi:glycosyltransferase involved in cell wall biosynthesis
MSLGKEEKIQIRILVLGQTPPPYHGQAIMIGEMLKGKYKKVELHHVRIHFSRESGEIGQFRVRKIFHLITTIFKIIYAKIKHNIEIFYYPPAGPNFIPVMRDLIVLSITRRFFKKTIFHFHACGVSLIYKNLPWFLRIVYRKSYFFPDVAIRLSEYNQEDGKFIRAKKEFIVPNGISDHAIKIDSAQKSSNVCRLLYVGRVIESKGIKILLEACHALLSKDVNFNLSIVGLFESLRFENEIMDEVKLLGLENHLEFPGFLLDEEKHRQYEKADIFCYPTFAESETFGIVLLEAMQFALPIVASKWQGVRSVVREEISGFLFPVGDSLALADKLELLVRDPQLRMRMGKAGRSIYLREYTFDRFREAMENIFLSLGEEKN